MESIHARRRYGWAPLYGFLDWPEKFVSAPAPELYDLGRSAETTTNNLGLVLGGLDRLAESEQAFRRALAIRPGFTIARFNVAFVLQSRGASREALAELERVEREEPDFPGLQVTMAEVRCSLTP